MEEQVCTREEFNQFMENGFMLQFGMLAISGGILGFLVYGFYSKITSNFDLVIFWITVAINLYSMLSTVVTSIQLMNINSKLNKEIDAETERKLLSKKCLKVVNKGKR